MRKSSFQKLAFLGLAMASAASIATSAEATLTLTSYGFAHGSKQATIKYNPAGTSKDVNVTANVGEFTLAIYDSSTKKTTDYLSYCVDIYQYIQTGSVSKGPWYTMSTLSAASKLNGVTIGQTELNQLNALVAHTQSLVTDSSHSAAVQMAIWDIIYDNSEDNSSSAKQHATDYFTSSYSNNYEGLFTASGYNLSATLSLADTYVKNVTTGIWQPSVNYTLSVLSSDKLQDQLVWNYTPPPPSPTPEPSTWAMMVLGFGAIGYGLRRRRLGDKAEAAA